MLVSVAAAAVVVPCRYCRFPPRCRYPLPIRLRLSRRRFHARHIQPKRRLLLLPRQRRPTLPLSRRRRRMAASAYSLLRLRHLPLRWRRPLRLARPHREC